MSGFPKIRARPGSKDDIMETKVGIVGHKGFVGSAFFEVFSENKKYSVVGIGKENYSEWIGERFGILINANGNSSKRLADSEPEKDWKMNVDATKRMLQDFPCEHYIHLSTVEVYNDKSSQDATREGAVIDAAKLSNYGKSKYEGERIAREHKSFLILRLAGMLGKNMKKGPAYDIIKLGKLFISGKSRLHFMDTAEVAAIAVHLADAGKWGEIYNVVGKGTIELNEFARIAGVALSATGKDVHLFNISTEKIGKEMDISTSMGTVARLIAGQKTK